MPTEASLPRRLRHRRQRRDWSCNDQESATMAVTRKSQVENGPTRGCTEPVSMMEARPVISKAPTKQMARSIRVLAAKKAHQRAVQRKLSLIFRVLAPPRRLLPSAIPPNNESTVKNK